MTTTIITNEELEVEISKIRGEFKIHFIKSKELIKRLGDAIKKAGIVKESDICNKIKSVLAKEIADHKIVNRTIELNCPDKWKKKTRPKNERISFSDTQSMTVDDKPTEQEEPTPVNMSMPPIDTQHKEIKKDKPQEIKRQPSPEQKREERQIKRGGYEGTLGIDGTDTAAKLIRILAGQRKDEYDDFNQELINKGRDWRLREMKRMYIQDLDRMYNYLDFLHKLINDILPVLDKESNTREHTDKLASP